MCVEARRSCTRTKPSYHPDTIICSDTPHGAEAGAVVIPYTAEDFALCVTAWRAEGARSDEGSGESPVSVRGCIARGVAEDVPNAAYGVEELIER